MKKFFIIPLILLLMACNPEGSDQQPVTPEIVAEGTIVSLAEVEYRTYEVQEDALGKATFSQAGDVVTIEISLTGMKPNSSKAVHIHNGTLEKPGRHWNAGRFIAACNERSLGQVWSKPFIGDVGNVVIDGEGNGKLVFQTDLWAINSGDEKDLLDKVIIVHDEPQDFIEECDPMHDHNHLHTNLKIGGGKIALVSDVARAGKIVIKSEKMPDFLICN